jgi:hypothetical protein
MACGHACVVPAELESPGCDESGLQGLAGRVRGQGGGHSAPRLVARAAEEPERGSLMCKLALLWIGVREGCVQT